MGSPGAKNWRVAPLGGQAHEKEIILLGLAEAPDRGRAQAPSLSSRRARRFALGRICKGSCAPQAGRGA